MESKQKTSKCNLFSDKKAIINKKSDLSDFSSSFSSHFILPSLSEDKNESPGNAGPKSHEKIEFKGARITRRSTRKHTHHIEKVELDFFDSDTDDYLV